MESARQPAIRYARRVSRMSCCGFDGHPENCYKLRASLWQNLKGDFVDEEETIFGRADRVNSEAGGVGDACRRGDPRRGRERADVLSGKEIVLRDGSRPASPAQAVAR